MLIRHMGIVNQKSTSSGDKMNMLNLQLRSRKYFTDNIILWKLKKNGSDLLSRL